MYSYIFRRLSSVSTFCEWKWLLYFTYNRRSETNGLIFIYLCRLESQGIQRMYCSSRIFFLPSLRRFPFAVLTCCLSYSEHVYERALATSRSICCLRHVTYAPSNYKATCVSTIIRIWEIALVCVRAICRMGTFSRINMIIRWNTHWARAQGSVLLKRRREKKTLFIAICRGNFLVGFRSLVSMASPSPYTQTHIYVYAIWNNRATHATHTRAIFLPFSPHPLKCCVWYNTYTTHNILVIVLLSG